MRPIDKDVAEIKQRALALRSLSNELLKIKDLSQLKTLADKASALTVWAQKQKKGRAMAIEASEIVVRAARRGGMILASMQKGYGRSGASKYSAACEEAELKLWQGALWQRLAAISDEDFDNTLAENRRKGATSSMRLIVRGKVDKKRKGCSLYLKFSGPETRRLDRKRRKYSLSREDYIKALLFGYSDVEPCGSGRKK